MERKEVLDALQAMRDASRERKFRQSVDLAINFKGIDFKKPENMVDVDVVLPHASGKEATGKSLVFVRDKDFAQQLRGRADRIILEEEIPRLKKADIDDIIKNYQTVLAEGPVMITVGKHLGQELAPKGRMPKPLAPKIEEFERAVSRGGSSTKVTNKKGKSMPLVHICVGKEDMGNADLAENILAVYDSVVSALAGKRQNVKSVCLKLTMGPSIRVGEKRAVEKQAAKPGAKQKNAGAAANAGNSRAAANAGAAAPAGRKAEKAKPAEPPGAEADGE